MSAEHALIMSTHVGWEGAVFAVAVLVVFLVAVFFADIVWWAGVLREGGGCKRWWFESTRLQEYDGHHVYLPIAFLSKLASSHVNLPKPQSICPLRLPPLAPGLVLHLCR